MCVRICGQARMHVHAHEGALSRVKSRNSVTNQVCLNPINDLTCYRRCFRRCNAAISVTDMLEMPVHSGRSAPDPDEFRWRGGGAPCLAKGPRRAGGALTMTRQVGAATDIVFFSLPAYLGEM